jgi:hypothetical protein
MSRNLRQTTEKTTQQHLALFDDFKPRSFTGIVGGNPGDGWMYMRDSI